MLINEVTDTFSVAQNSSVKLYRGIGNMSSAPPGTEKLQPIRNDRRLLHSSPLSGIAFDTAMAACGYPMRKSKYCVCYTRSPTSDILRWCLPRISYERNSVPLLV